MRLMLLEDFQTTEHQLHMYNDEMAMLQGYIFRICLIALPQNVKKLDSETGTFQGGIGMVHQEILQFLPDELQVWRRRRRISDFFTVQDVGV